MEYRKTIFLTSFHVLISRNILSGTLLSLLDKARIRVILIVPDYKVEYFKSTFSQPNVVIEGIKAYEFSKRSIMGLIMKRMARPLVVTPTTTVRMRQKLVVEKKFFYFYFFMMPIRLLARFHFFISFARYVDYLFSPKKGFFNELLLRYKPDLVVATDVNNENDVAIMQDAARIGVPYISILRSWDNLTNFLIRRVPMRLIVQNEILKSEAIRYHWMKPEAIRIMGIPHYDRYREGSATSRSDFFKRMGFDEKKKYILYVPIGDFRVKDNDVDSHVLNILSELDANILVRIPPTSTARLDGLYHPEKIKVDIPGRPFAGMKGLSEITRADDEHLIDSIAHADVVVSGPGTMNIDTAVFDKPIVLVNFYPSPRGRFEGIIEYEYEHISHILKSGGVKIATSKETLIRFVQEYVRNPDIDHVGRMRIFREQAVALDGKGNERLCSAIIEAVRDFS